MGKLVLNPSPTFFGEVAIPVPGKGDVKVKFEFKHRTRDQFDSWLKSRSDRNDVESIMDMVVGWDVDDPFSVDNVTALSQNYIGASAAIFDTYFSQLVKGRSGN